MAFWECPSLGANSSVRLPRCRRFHRQALCVRRHGIVADSCGTVSCGCDASRADLVENHPGQEFKREKLTHDYLSQHFVMSMDALNDAVCPLSLEERREAVRRCKRRQVRTILRLAASGQLDAAGRVFRTSPLLLGDFAKAFSRAERPVGPIEA